MAKDDIGPVDKALDDLFSRFPTKGYSEFSSTTTRTETKSTTVRIKLNNQQYRKLLNGEPLEYKVAGHQVLVILPTDVRDVVHRTSTST